MILSDFNAICGEEFPHFLIFDFSTAPPLLFYSYVPIAIAAILLAAYIMHKDKYALRSKLLFLVSSLFALWMINILVQWVASYHTALLFGWQLTALFEVGLFVSALYFFIVFTTNKDASVSVKYLLALPIIVTAILTPTVLNIASYDVASCEGDLGILWTAIYYFLEPVIILLIPIIGALNYKQAERKRPLITTTLGLTAFLFIFYLSNVAGELTQTYETNLVGPLGMVIFQILLVYNIVKFDLFKTKVAATEAFVGLIILLIFSLTFVRTIENVRTISIVTGLAMIYLGFLLVRSVRREIKQKEEIEKLAIRLEKANKRLKILDQLKSEFVSVASHQLRSPLTSIRGYASMLLEGSFGKLSAKGKEAVERIADSSKYMAMSVEDYLNVSRIEAGRMTYEMSDFNLKEIVERITDDIRPAAIKKGLVLTSKTSDLTSRATVHADIGKTQQIIHNMVDNALKYTPKGSVVVRMRDNKKKKKIYIDIVDSGVGMQHDVLEEVFDKFVRARNANHVNVTGTGLGLYVAQQMSKGMKGLITATSDGEGNGSVFTLELPLVS
ncbi:MAG: signal transduction histidine kinase [Candidatus Azotimanducaceae bacterium]|jgi:signal transduction histidine kinase